MANIKQVKQTVSKGFQWHVKWVRVMIILSVFAVIAIILFPTGKKEKAPEIISMSDSLYFKYEEPVFDTIVRTSDSTQARILIRRRMPTMAMRDTVPYAMPAPAPVDNTKDVDDTTTKSAPPIQIQIVEPPKPFDWKGTVTWMIGAINGLVLVIMNLKNILTKKTP